MTRLYGAGMNRAVFSVAIGGVVGALIRWGVFETLGEPTPALLIVNTVGSALLALVVARWPRADHPQRLGLGVGFCGGLTTFSGFAIDIAVRLEESEPLSAVTTTVVSLALAVAAYVLVRRFALRGGLIP